MQRKMAEAAVATYGLPRDVPPDQALLEEVHRTAGHVAWLAARVTELDPGELVWSRRRAEKITATEFPGTNITIAAEINVWVDLYLRERRHLVDVCKAAIAAGIEERRVKLAEDQGQLLADILRAVFADPELGMSEAQRQAAPGIIRRHLAVVG